MAGFQGDGKPVGGAEIFFYIDDGSVKGGRLAGTAVTDSDGRAKLDITQDVSAGTHGTWSASYTGFPSNLIGGRRYNGVDSNAAPFAVAA